MKPSDSRRLLRGLIAACHPGPTLVVTVGVTAVAAAMGHGPVGSLLVMLAILTGQLTTGWTNDARDAPTDVSAGRWEKPVVRGWVTPRALWTSAVLAAALCVPLSVAAGGVIGGAAHILAVASACAYDLWLKGTAWSFVPFMVSFGLLAPFLSFGLDPPQPPGAWAIATLSLLGLSAHLANGIPDIEDDTATGTQGVVARLGAATSARLAALALLAGSAVMLWRLDLPELVSIALLGCLAAVTALASLRWGGRHLFPVVMALALANAGLLCLSAATISGV